MSAITVKLYKAGRVANLEAPDLVVKAFEEFPEGRPPAVAARLHQDDAARLADALLASLPGGTIDRLLLHLLEHRARPAGEKPERRYYLEMVEDDHRLPKGRPDGYATLGEAEEAARRHTDDALPRNTVRVYQHVATAYVGGDGVPYVS